MDSIFSTSLEATPASHWAISYQQLLDVDAQARAEYQDRGHDYAKKTMRDINSDIIVKEQESNLSYALSKNRANPLKVEAFVTHCWDEPFEEFVQSIREAFDTQAIRPNLWICAFALKQGDCRILAQQLGSSGDVDLKYSPFAKALKEATHFVVVRNRKTDLYSRAWCVYELLYARTQTDLVPNGLHVTGPNTFADAHPSCETAAASSKTDEERISAELQRYGAGEINKIVRYFQNFPDAPLPANFTTADFEEEDRHEDAPLVRPSTWMDPNPKAKKPTRYVSTRISVAVALLAGLVIHALWKEHQSFKGNLWGNELYPIKELEGQIGRSFQFHDAGNVPYSSPSVTLTASQQKGYGPRCIVEVSVSGQSLLELPKSIDHLQCLVFLDISNNNLTFLPDIFRSIPTLSFVDLRGNPFLQLPSSLNNTILQGTVLVDGLPSVLDRVAKNDLAVILGIQKQLGPQVQLELKLQGHLAASSKRPESNGYPMFIEAESLLDRSTNLLVTVNSEGRVTDLSIQGRGLETLPESVFQLQQLHNLLLRNNNLTTLPDNFGNITHLYLLDVADNPFLKSLPVSLQKKIREGETRLAFGKSLPVPTDQVLNDADFDAIRELQVSVGNITILSEVGRSKLGMTLERGRVQHLSLRGQGLKKKDIKASFLCLKELNSLDLSNNSFRGLPDIFNDLPLLSDVYLGGNPRILKKSLPGSLRDNPRIQVHW